jgi:fumarylacetoacetate (FAA) hydrolase family protein
MFSDTQFVQNAMSVRFQSTIIHTAIQNTARINKKKVKKFRKKYAEVVEGKNVNVWNINQYTYFLSNITIHFIATQLQVSVQYQDVKNFLKKVNMHKNYTLHLWKKLVSKLWKIGSYAS